MGNPARAMVAWLAAAYPAGRECGPNRQAERLGRRCGRPSPANGAAPQDTPLIPGLACAASQADAVRRRLPAAGHRTPALPVPLLRTPGGRAADLVGTTGPPAHAHPRSPRRKGTGGHRRPRSWSRRYRSAGTRATGRHQPQARGGDRPGSWAGVDRSVAIGAIWVRAGPGWQRLATPACARLLQS